MIRFVLNNIISSNKWKYEKRWLPRACHLLFFTRRRCEILFRFVLSNIVFQQKWKIRKRLLRRALIFPFLIWALKSVSIRVGPYHFSKWKNMKNAGFAALWFSIFSTKHYCGRVFRFVLSIIVSSKMNNRKNNGFAALGFFSVLYLAPLWKSVSIGIEQFRFSKENEK